MKKRPAVWLVAVLVVLAALALLVPGSPAYLPNFYQTEGQYDGHAASYWVKALHNPDENARYQAIFALGAIGSEAGEAVSPLAQIMLEDPDIEARHQAAFALTKMAPASRAVVPQLTQAVESPQPHVRMNAIMALFQLKEEAAPAVPALLRAVQDKQNQTNLDVFHLTIQSMAVRTLGRASHGSDTAVPLLRETLTGTRNPELRWAIAVALGEIGAPARPAAPDLRALLEDESRTVRESAGEALAKIEEDTNGGKNPQAGKTD
jgi:HEAT repeat protein